LFPEIVERTAEPAVRAEHAIAQSHQAEQDQSEQRNAAGIGEQIAGAVTTGPMCLASGHTGQAVLNMRIRVVIPRIIIRSSGKRSKKTSA
jgi:hypothetical protein